MERSLGIWSPHRQPFPGGPHAFLPLQKPGSAPQESVHDVEERFKAYEAL